MNKTLRIFLLTLLLCGFMQAMADRWTDSNGLTWSFTVNGTEATDIKFYSGPDSKKIYIYGDPNRSEEEIAADPQLPFVPDAWDHAAMRFSDTEGSHLPTIPDDVYFSLKTLIFDVSDVTANFDMKVMNGWWSNTYYDHVKWENGLNELQITPTMADECAKGGGSRDLVLMLYSGSMTFNAVYYESSEVSGDVVIPAKVYDGSKELTVTSIGNSAFYACSALTSVTIPEGVTSIGDNAFYGCSALTGISIPEGVTSIGNSAFCRCSGLTDVTIPEGVTSIGNSAFYACSALTSVTIPEGVTSIGDYAFLGCTGLTNVTIPSSVTSIGNYAFYNCDGLTSVTIPEGVTSFGDMAFAWCDGLTCVTIGDGVTSIGNYAFYCCFGLTILTIPSSVTTIGNYAFYACYGITSVTIPESVTSFGDMAFSCCFGLTSISVESGNSVYDSRNNCNAIIETATNTLIQGCNNTIIPEDVTSIGDYAFYNCFGLTSVTIPEGVTSIGYSTFSGCYSLTSVIIPSSVTSIGNYAFYGCYALTNISVESGNSVYDSRNNCNAIIETATNTLIQGCNNTIIPEDVTSIGDYAFYACDGITSVTIPEGVTSIGKYAFYECSNLTTVTSRIKEPFEITENVFTHYDYDNDNYVFTSATLYVPAGTKSLYEATPAWNQFEKIVEMGGSEGIQSPIDHSPLTIDYYYTPDGRKIEGIPAKKGLYIVNGRKVLVF